MMGWTNGKEHAISAKMAEVVCARNFLLAKGDEADFASDYEVQGVILL